MLETASRLREIQEDFADEPAEERHRHLADEVRAALEKLVPDQREPFVRALAEYFPAPDWGDGRAPAASGPRDGAGAAQPDARLDDPHFLVDRLVEICSAPDAAERLPPDRKQQLVERLRGAGLIDGDRSGAEGIPGEALDRLRLALHPGAAKKQHRIDAGAAIEVLAMLAPFVDRLNSSAWTTLKRLTPRAPSPSELRTLLATCVAGDPKAPPAAVKAQLERLQTLLGALLTALSHTPGYADAYHEEFAPHHIEQKAREGRTALAMLKEGINSACWQSYRTLYDKMEKPAEDMRQRIIDCVQKIDQTTRLRT